MENKTIDEKLFDELYGVQPQAIIWMRPVWDKKGKLIDFQYTYTNDEGLKYLNVTREKLGKLTLSNSPTLSDPLRVSIFKEMLTVYNDNVTSETVIYNPALKKDARVLRTRLRDGILNVIQDISKEKEIIKQLEYQKKELQEKTRQLEEQTSLLNKIMENSSNGISVSEIFRDQNGKVVDALTTMANDAAVNYIGLPRDIYLSKRATEIEPEIIGSPYYQMCIKTLETGEPFVTQYFVNATKRWLELTVSKMDYNHLIHIFTDVTSIKQAQLELEKMANSLQIVFDSAQAGLSTLAPQYDEKGNITDFEFVMINPTVATYMGKLPDSLKGEPVSSQFPAYLQNGMFEMYRHTFETGEAQRKEIHYIEDGHDLYLDVHTAKVGEQLLVSSTDHTSLRKSQLQLQQTVTALKRSNTYLEDFAHVASHDMKEPLRKILTFTSRLKVSLGNRIDETEEKFMDRIQTSAERMLQLVNDILEFSHVSDQTGNMEPIDLNEKIQNVLTDLELPIEEKQARIIVDHLPVVTANRRQMQQLFLNLIGNAIKYSKKEVSPEILIKYREVNGDDTVANIAAEHSNRNFHLIEVIDNGIGFEQQYSEKIFDMLQRLHKKSEFSGTGIGLSIARKVVENHNWYIWAKGEPGVGSTFSILIPAN